MKTYMMFLLSLLMACMLQVLPLPPVLVSIAPQWVTLVIIYWVLKQPHCINVTTAWLAGFVVDGLTGSMLGLHGVSFALIACIVSSYASRLAMFHIVQQMTVVALLCWINNLVIACLHYWFGQPPVSFLWWLSPLLSAIIWAILAFHGKKDYALY